MLAGALRSPAVQSILRDPVATAEPPRFVCLVAHPVRWRLLQELVRSDRAVSELVELVDEAQNLVSYHLRQLRDGGLVVARRSSADGRDVYYAIDLTACRAELDAAGGALHPALGRAPAAATPRSRATRVLFLCMGNSARSQMAEALVESLSEASVRAVSAGSHPKPLHPNAVRAMRARGIDLRGHRAKHLDEFASERFDIVITLCDKVREVCPEFPSHPRLVHWSIADPALAGATNRASYRAFADTAAALETRIRMLLYQLAATSRRSTHANR
jgi:protein-tyrosine-phosphatase